MSYRSFNRIATALYLTVMTVWSGMRYYRSGHLVYHSGADAWWVQAGVPMAHVSTGAASNLATLGKNLLGCMGTVQKINRIVHSGICGRHGHGICSRKSEGERKWNIQDILPA